MTKRIEEPTIVIEKPTPSKAIFLDFETEREEWNKYVLEDESILRAKFILTGAMIDKTIEEIREEAKSGQKLRIGFTIRSQNVFSVESPPRLRGPPDSKRYSPEELRASIVKEELDLETIRETWNSYLLENGMRMKAKISPISVNRTSKYDSGGMPVYTIDTTVGVKLMLPQDIEKIRKEHAKAKLPE